MRRTMRARLFMQVIIHNSEWSLLLRVIVGIKSAQPARWGWRWSSAGSTGCSEWYQFDASVKLVSMVLRCTEVLDISSFALGLELFAPANSCRWSRGERVWWLTDSPWSISRPATGSPDRSSCKNLIGGILHNGLLVRPFIVLGFSWIVGRWSVRAMTSPYRDFVFVNLWIRLL